MTAPLQMFDLRTRSESDANSQASVGSLVAHLVSRSNDAPWWKRISTWYDPRPLYLDVDGDAWTLRATPSGIETQHGTNNDNGNATHLTDGAERRAARLMLTQTDLCDLVNDLATPIGWWTSGHLDIGRDLNAISDWWLLIRALLDDRIPYHPDDLQIADPSTWMRSFRAGEDSVDDMRSFLGEYGFLHLKGLFSATDMEAVSADMDAMASMYSPGDDKSWWATDSSGVRHLVRCHDADKYSPTIADLVTRPEFLSVGDIPGVGHQWANRGYNRIEALNKPLNIVEGISDVPWHKDCSLGRHSYFCCRLTVGISVTAGALDTGLLRVVAGSHRALTWPALARQGMELPVVELPTEVGDVTVHLSCLLHEALPPTRIPRRVLYTDFDLPQRDGNPSLDSRFSSIRERAAKNVSQPAANGPRPSFD